jgi:hypothetical protein
MQSQGVEQLSVFELQLLTESLGFLFLLSVCSGHTATNGSCLSTHIQQIAQGNT